jgi:hypothetical protein
MAKEQIIIRPHAGFQEKFVRTNVDVCFAGGVLNCGKAQPLYSLILTPRGWKRMGEVSVGDTICDTKGGIQKIEEVFERGTLDCKEVIFDDGSVVKCCAEHLWRVWNKKKHKYETLELNDIMKDPKIYSVDLPSAVSFEGYKAKVIHPYLLGLLIGDAYMGSEDGGSVKINTDRESVDRAFTLKPFDYMWRHYANRMAYAIISDKTIREEIKRIGLFEKKSHEKFIPKEYLYTTIEERTELLRGLFDTDGYNDKLSNRVEYSTVSEQLAKDVCFLVRSLGGKVSISTKTGSYLDKEQKKVLCKKVYRLSCRFQDTNHFFALSRKMNNVEQKRRIALNFKQIKDCGKEAMRCIRVSNPNHLYITDDFVVTHNTAGAVLMCGEPSQDSRFRGVFLRNNLGDLKSGGGILDEFRSMYRGGVEVVESGDPRVVFPSGARIDVTHIADQNREKVRQRFKGRQYDLIYFDEMTGFTWECFTEVCTRNRGTASWTGKIRGTTNPERDHWLRVFLDWYIGIDGFIREDREGVVRYFYMAGATVKDVVWGDSKEEVYRQCKADIDRKLAKINGKTGTATWENMIKSFTFYLGRMSENTSSIGNNSDYVGTVAMSGGANSEQLLEGNWNVSSKDMIETAIPNDMARQVFLNDPATNGDKWITCDLADVGTDNFTAIAWDGFHIYDMLVVGKTTPRQNAELLLNFAKKHDIGPSHIVYDGTRGLYISDYIPDAIPFVSAKKSEGMYYLEARNLKDECFMRLAEAIKRGEFSIADEVANRKYEHQRLKETISIQNEFLEECAVVYFVDAGSGKKRMPSKKEMNAKLGKDRSMDILDPCAMRMYPYLEYVYGEELIKTASWYKNADDDDDDEYDAFGFRKQTIYDDTLWS